MRNKTKLAIAWAMTFMMSACALGQAALAYVDGSAIPRQEVVDMLMKTHGLDVLQQLILLRLAKKEAEKLGYNLTQRDLDLEWTRALERVSPDDPDLPPAENRKNRENALRFILEQRGMTEQEFRISTDRNAYLRKIVERDISVSEATLREEYERTFGARVEVRHIEVGINDRARLQEAQSLLQRGEPFEQVARRISQNAATAPGGGRLPAFTFDDRDIPPIIREKAFTMAPGDISNPIRVDQVYQILKLERRTAAQGQAFHQVRSEVEESLRERVAQEKMPALMNELFRRSKIQILDPELRQQFNKMIKGG